MQEELISFETAVLAKEKGFNWKVRCHYRDGHAYTKELICGGSLYNMNSHEEQELWITNLYSAPTQGLLQKWLREVRGIHITIDHVDNTTEFYYDYSVVNRNNREYQDEDMTDQAKRINHYTKEYQFDTFEEALEIALQEALKLI